jgi:RHS repeat-associated protein
MAASNRTQKVVTVSGTPTTTNYSYNPLNQLTSDGTKTYSYDANGNLISNGTDTYTWDRANRLLAFGGSSYQYNGLGQRVKQTVNSIATQYLLDTQPGLYKVLAVTTGSNTDRYIHDPMGIAQHEDNVGNWHFLTHDGLGTVRHVYDDNLSEIYAVERDPYGVEIAHTGSNPTPFEYTGEPLDQNSLLHLRARYYDPTLGVFVSLDPLETANRYGYAGGDPVNHSDPSGMSREMPSDYVSCSMPPSTQLGTMECSDFQYSNLANIELWYFSNNRENYRWIDIPKPSTPANPCRALDNCLRSRIISEIACYSSPYFDDWLNGAFHPWWSNLPLDSRENQNQFLEGDLTVLSGILVNSINHNKTNGNKATGCTREFSIGESCSRTTVQYYPL